MYAVYGTLRKGWGNHRRLESSSYLGTMITPPVFKMVDLGYFPAVTEGNSSIVVEVYEVDRITEQSLFQLEGYQPGRKSNLYEVTTFESEFGPLNIFTMSPDRVAHETVIEEGDWNKWKQKSIAR